MRSAAEGEHRTGEDVGEAEPLMPLERPKPLVWGAVKEAKRPAACTPDDRGRLAPLAGEGRGGVTATASRSAAALSWKSSVPHRRNLLPLIRGDMTDGSAQSGTSWHKLISAANRRPAKNR